MQDFIPSPMDLAATMYYTGLDPIDMEPVAVAKNLRDRRLQRALLQFFKPENWFEVRRALEQAGREDLIGDGPDRLIPSRPPREAVEARRRNAREEGAKTKAADERSIGYRPHRKGWKARRKKGARPGGGAPRGGPQRGEER
ncbi:MAG: DUF3362 domain-containing protein [Planctomycetota bacterium]